MMKILEWVKEAKVIATIIFTLFSLTTATITGYNVIKSDIKSNTESFEVFQMQMLAPIVRYAEKNPCAPSDAEWTDYKLNYNTLFNLQKIYEDVPSEAYDRQKRLEEDKSECIR